MINLERDQILDLARRFDHEYAQLWSDVAVLAGRFKTSPTSHNPDLAWHHLLMAVGNFKRHAPIHPKISLPAVERDANNVVDLEEIDIPGACVLRAEGQATWEELEKMTPGLGVATTTAVLSALWPDCHVIFDRLTASAVVGLAASEGTTHAILRDVKDGIRSTDNLPSLAFRHYVAYREDVLGLQQELAASAGDRPALQPVNIERALFLLARNTPQEKGRTWEQYGGALLGTLEQVRSDRLAATD